MTTYRVPTDDILATLRFGLAGRSEPPAELVDGTMAAFIEQAGRFAQAELLPLDAVGDREGLRFADGAVTTAPGWRDAYRHWVEAGWNGLTAPAAFGGQGLGALTHAAVQEIWHGTNLSFALCPLLTAGAIEALASHATPELQGLYLPKLVSGEWAGTMNLTEPQAGSDLGALRTTAEPLGDGRYRLTGEKIYISYGEHDLTENIIHLVLARLPDAPPGSRGISLFLVPKVLVGGDGTLSERNAVTCIGIERKLGMHAAPTCTMRYEGATGFLVGEADRGLNAMFTMMNQARLAVGLEGVGAAERATQSALRFARERRQGRAAGRRDGEPNPIIDHPDVARMLVAMRALTAAARALCYLVAQAIDESRDARLDAAGRKAAAETAALLTPVAKAFATEAGIEAASLNVQVHGGAGYIEASGAAQIARDIRITSIYEGTNGIQAIDLVTRKIGVLNGDAMERELGLMRAVAERAEGVNEPSLGIGPRLLREAVEALAHATAFLDETLAADPPRALAGATPYLRLFGLARGGTALAQTALSSGAGRHLSLFRAFAEQFLASAPGLATTVVEGADGIAGWATVLDEG